MTAVVDVPVGSAAPKGEAPIQLTEDVDRVLGWWDQLGLWANLGTSILGPVGAIYVLSPDGIHVMSFLSAVVATVVGTLIGTAMLAASAVPGAQTGSPAMVLLRGLFGVRLSYLPSVLNGLQLVGWSAFEIVVISEATEQLLPWHAHLWPYVIVAGILTILMAIRPLGAVRILRRFALVGVTVVITYLFIELLRHPMPSLTHGGWTGFWGGTDYTIAIAVSFAPLASDYSRHAKSAKSAFSSAMIGYSVAQAACYVLGLVALLTVVSGTDVNLQSDLFARFIAVPVGGYAFAILVARELDQSFADSYSTVVSLQNIFPKADRRLLAVIIGSIATAIALVLGAGSYQNFLLLLGSIFVPLTAVFLVDYFVRRRSGWNVSGASPLRLQMVLPWFLGIVVYELINPGYVGWWVTMWAHISSWIHFTPQSWMSASLSSFVIAALVALPLSLIGARGSRFWLGSSLRRR